MAIFQDSKELTDGSTVVALEDGTGNPISSTSGSLNVNVTNGSSGQVADKTAFTYGTSLELTVGAVFQDTSPTVTAGSTNALRMNAQRGLHTNLRNASGVEIGVSGSAVVVDGSAVTQPISAASLPLPANAAQETGGHLASLDSKISPSSAALSQLSLTNASQTALASNASRKGFIMVNDSNKIVYVAFSATTTSAAYTYKIQPNTTIEPNFGSYTGVISAISITGVSGSLVITELS